MEEIFIALGEQAVTVVGTAAVEMVIGCITAQLKELKHQWAVLTNEVEKLVDDLTLSQVLISRPGAGIKTTATTFLSIGDGSTFKDAAHLRAYAVIATTSRSSGTSIHGEHPSWSGNKALKDAFFRSAWVASCHDPLSIAYYQSKRREGKKHNAAIVCLARRRCDVLYAKVKNGTLYETRTPKAA